MKYALLDLLASVSPYGRERSAIGLLLVVHLFFLFFFLL